MDDKEQQDRHEFAEGQIKRSEEVMKGAGIAEDTQARVVAALRGVFAVADELNLSLTMMVRIAGYHCDVTGHNHTPRVEAIQIELEGFEPEPDERDSIIPDTVNVMDMRGLKEFLTKRTRETRSN